MFGIVEYLSPDISYSTATCTSSNPSRTSNLVRHKCDIELFIMAFLKATISNHPHRLGRPVVAPNSTPTSARCLPLLSFNSVGNGPDPTRVV